MNISETATAIFGPAADVQNFFGSTSPQAIVSVAQAASGAPDQQVANSIVTAQKREINRIRGFKVDLTPIDTQKLVELREEIQAIDDKINRGVVRPDELEERAEKLEEADVILGKPIVDVEADETLAGYNSLRVAILEPKLDGATARRVEYFERVRDSIETQLNANPGRQSLQILFRAAVNQIDTLKPLRSPSDLSPTERKVYDDVVELINDHAGVKIALTARESDRVEALEASIARFEGA